MGLSPEPEEPGYGIFYNIKILSNDEVEIDKITQSVTHELSCKNDAIKPLLNKYYTVNFDIYDSNNKLVVKLLTNKVSCGI
ncbi:hypothetical protein MOMOMM052B1_18910 [Morganella morganii]